MPFDTKDPKEQSLRIDELSILVTKTYLLRYLFLFQLEH